MMARLGLLAISSILASLVSASFFPPPLEGVENKTSSFDSNIAVSSKDASAVCETTPNVKSYSGYVSMSAASLEFVNGRPGFPVNTFYWFFESRKDPKNAPFVLWLGGGPGFSGIASALFENGPCTVNDDSNSTTLNPFSWNNEANIIYIDSPAMTGYSYDILVNATIDGLNSSLPIIPSLGQNLPEGNTTFQVGTFGSQDPTQLSNSTGNVVPVIWTAMQAWFANFPQYKPANGAMSIWTESYGGRFGPLTADFFMKQNDAIAAGRLPKAVPLRIDTLGIINGYIEPALHAQSYPTWVNNNTYGIKTVPDEVQASMQQNLTKAGGCLDAIDACQAMTNVTDAKNTATNQTTNKLCSDGFLLCRVTVQKAYDAVSNRSQDDIAHPRADATPSQHYVGFLNQAWVQQALGARVNFTANSDATLTAFFATGDLARTGARQALGRLLDARVQVVLLGGDRDYQVNVLGIESVSRAIEHRGQGAFQGAGFANLTAANGTSVGLVRQAAGLAFARIFQAGHSVPAYQPEVALTVFSRAMGHRDVATGQVDVGGAGRGGRQTSGQPSRQNGTTLAASSPRNYATTGMSNVFDVKNAVPPAPEPVCYTWSIGLSCTEAQQGLLAMGQGVVKNFILQDTNGGGIDGNATVANLNAAGTAAGTATGTSTAAAAGTSTGTSTGTATATGGSPGGAVASGAAGSQNKVATGAASRSVSVSVSARLWVVLGASLLLC